MSLIALVQYGTPLLLLGILYYIASLSPVVKQILASIVEIKAGMVWEKTCIAHREEINRRLDKLDKED